MAATTRKAVCRHCGDEPVTRPRGLGWKCYHDPEIKALYPSANPAAVWTPRVIACVWCGHEERETWADCWSARLAPAGAYRVREWRCLACTWRGWPDYPPVTHHIADRPLYTGHDIPRVARLGAGLREEG
jgi:hypothetical protein